MTKPKKPTYEKHQSFEAVHSRIAAKISDQRARVCRLLAEPGASSLLPAWAQKDILGEVRSSLETGLSTGGSTFALTQFIADELSFLSDKHVPLYMFHRYRYDVLPREHLLDEYPPYMQIEPTSVCNFRCIFCYQTDPTFSRKSSGMMGSMEPELFRDVVDSIVGSVEFISLASRGEPLINRKIDEILAHTVGKFIGLKMNTNASLLTEEKAHAILQSGISTLVFSADAAKEPMYSKLRVKGSLERTVANIRLFQEIHQKHYPRRNLITRVSGVMYDPENQDINEMVGFWGDLVDQVAFVAYNPWENVYEAAPNGMETPCSDLWRRLFVWYDGSTNPCDTDYKSVLSPGSIVTNDVPGIWRGAAMQSLRDQHAGKQRQDVHPCRGCSVI